MPEIILLFILICSFIGMGAIVLLKIPALVKLPQKVSSQPDWKNAFLDFIKRIKDRLHFKNFSSEIFLQKILSKIRILTLKVESKTSNWLQQLRERSQKNKFGEDDNYWQAIRKSTNQAVKKSKRKTKSA